MRKCATLEAGGTSAHDALLASAGFQAGEIEALQTRAKQSEEELKQAREREAQLQPALDQAKTTIAQRDKELKDIRQILNKTAETEKGSRQSIEALNRQISELQLAIAAYKEKLTRTISTDGLGKDALAVPLAIARPMLKPPSQNKAVMRCAHSRPYSRVPPGASGWCCGYSERPTRDDGQRRLVLLW
jgi:septal ring factor EnvC (AmiA/AmiB activator)